MKQFNESENISKSLTHCVKDGKTVFVLNQSDLLGGQSTFFNARGTMLDRSIWDDIGNNSSIWGLDISDYKCDLLKENVTTLKEIVR